MKRIIKMKRYAILVIMIVMAHLAPGSSFAGAAGQPAMDENSLKKQVTLEWEARRTNNWGEIYNLTSNDYRAKTSRETFGAKSNTTTERFRIRQIAIDAAQKRAAVKVDYTIVANGIKFPFVSHETWVWEENQWRLVPLQ